jgi:hypothetical protein
MDDVVAALEDIEALQQGAGGHRDLPPRPVARRS